MVISSTPVHDYRPVASDPRDLVTLAMDTYVDGGQEQTITASVSWSERLGCEAGAELFLFEGPRFKRGDSTLPLCWSEQYLPVAFGADRYQLRIPMAGTATVDATEASCA